MAPRTYTVEEANSALPEVGLLVQRIMSLSLEIPELQERARVAEMKHRRAIASSEPAVDPGGDSKEDLARASAALRAAEMSLMVALRSLEERDVQLKDASIGLVDFYGYVGDELVELCWRVGEESVTNWHRVGEGYAGRKPLDRQ